MCSATDEIEKHDAHIDLVLFLNSKTDKQNTALPK
jgi:hypothetical protein